ncbi:SDR family oxidoreductase [bacterium]|nr:SDR family oxidoreductase [bacterium]
MSRKTRSGEKARTGVLVTGASSGIGKAIAFEFAAREHDVFLVARNEQRLAELAQRCRAEHSVNAAYLVCDLSKPDAADTVHNWIRKQGFSVDVLVNNAGFDIFGPVSETDAKQESELLAVNIHTLTMLTKKFLPRMIKRGRGRVLNIGSTGSLIPTPLNAVYCASKAYVLSFSAALSEECLGTGVTVTCACPGATRSRFHERAGMEQVVLMKYPVMEAEAVARACVNACLAGRRMLVVGTFNKLSMYAMSLMPLSWRVKLAKQFTKQ